MSDEDEPHGQGLRSVVLQECKSVLLYFHNCLSSSEVTTALRPFYFLVHPDLFAQHPRAQYINDSNLKLLNSHLDSLVTNEVASPLTLLFYVRSCTEGEALKTKSLVLNKRSVKLVVQNILTTFKLPTNYVDKLEEKSNKMSLEKNLQDVNFYYVHSHCQEENFNVPKMKDNLYSWLVKNMGEAEKRLSASEPIRNDIIRLKEDLIDQFLLLGLTWERGIGTHHLRGCLQGLKALENHYSQANGSLQGRHVHFGNETGVSLNGTIILSTSEVRDQWFQLISRVPTQDRNIQRIPFMQKAVSNTLRDIQVTHRKYQPFLLAESYSQYLRKLVTSLGDFIGKTGYPKIWPSSLAHLQLVVESAASPLMLSPTGQIIAPSSCPPWLLVNFITDNMEEASQLIANYETLKLKEKELLLRCQEELTLSFLDKDDSLSPAQMMTSLNTLLENSYRLTPLLAGARLWITHYYSVMLDGEVCIPFDFYKQSL